MQTIREKIHVLHIPRWYPHRSDPMLGLFVKNHIESLAKKCDNSVLFLHFVEDQGPVFSLQTTNYNDVYCCTAYIRKAAYNFPLASHLINLVRYYRAYRRCFKLIKQNRGKHDLVHVHVLTRTGLFALFNKMLNGVPYVITEHWTRYLPTTDTYHGSLRKLLTQLVVRKAGAAMPVTANLRDAMIANKLKNENYVVVPNVVDVAKFKPAVKRTEKEKKVFVHLSCFTDHQKNISGILRVIKKLSERRDDFMLKLIGDGEDFSKMKELSDQLQLTDRFVFFTGLKQDQELVELLNSADLMIMFSNYENLPVVILESYACGVPVISSRVGGIHEHMNDSLGRLVEPGNENQFLESLNNFLDNPEVYESEKIRKYAVDHFSREVIGNSFFEVYRNVLNTSVKQNSKL